MSLTTTSQLVCRHNLVPTNCAICQPTALYTHDALRANLDALLEEARPRLLRLVRLNGVVEDVVDDVVQETLVEAWRHIEQLRAPERFASWLDGICRNICRRQTRAQASTSHEHYPWWGEESPAGPRTFDLADPLAIDPSEELERQDMQILLDRALGYLSTSSRELIERCYLAELPQREVAQQLDISLGALELKLHRARKQLRQVLNCELRADAAAFGLLLNEDEAMGWQETRQWCWLCAKQRLRGKFERHSSGGMGLRLRCPDCSPRYDVDITSTGDWPVPGLEALRSFRPAIKRVLASSTDSYGSILQKRRCPACQSPIQVQIVDRDASNPSSYNYDALPQGFYLRVDCPRCGEFLSELISALLLDPVVQEFVINRPCVLSEPNIPATCAGQDVIRSRLVDKTTSEQLTIMTHLENLQVLATFID